MADSIIGGSTFGIAEQSCCRHVKMFPDSICRISVFSWTAQRAVIHVESTVVLYLSAVDCQIYS